MSSPPRDRPDRVIVLGLGRFGSNAARTLEGLGYEVTALDLQEPLVAAIADSVSLAVQGDSTDEAMLRSLDVERNDVAIVSQGESVESSLTTALLLKQLGVHQVIATAKSEIHASLLRRVGADRVVFPERDAAERLSRSLAVTRVDDYLGITERAGVAMIHAPEAAVGETLADLERRCGSTVHVVGLVRGGRFIPLPDGETSVGRGDALVILGDDATLEQFAQTVTP